MSQGTHGDSSVYDLPTDLLAGVLQHVEQKDRLQSCAMVCKRWQQASNMATRRVLDAADTAQALWSLSAWLHSNKYASSLQCIQLRSSYIGSTVLQLPFHRLAGLEELKLGRCHLTATPAQCNTYTPPSAATASAAFPTQFSSLAALTALSRMELTYTRLDLRELGSCIGLRHLDLNMVCHVIAEDPSVAETDSSIRKHRYFPVQLSAALPQLSQLTYLDLQLEYHQPATTVCLSSLQQLRSLKLGGASVKAIDLTQLPTVLTSLQLGPAPISITMPPLQNMKDLQCLHLVDIRVNSFSLSSATQLTRLALHDCTSSAVAAVEGLLLALGQMKQLKHLRFKTLSYDEDELDEEDLPDRELFAAVTASSHLTCLDLKDCWLPILAEMYIFPAAGALNNLKVLNTGLAMFTNYFSFSHLVACCPSLEQFEVELEEWMVDQEHRMRRDEEFSINEQGQSDLRRLTALTKLSFKEIDLTDDAMSRIAACTQLRDLTLQLETPFVPLVSDAGMLCLTQLSSLTKLDMRIFSKDHHDVKHQLGLSGSWISIHLAD